MRSASGFPLPVGEGQRVRATLKKRGGPQRIILRGRPTFEERAMVRVKRAGYGAPALRFRARRVVELRAGVDTRPYA